MAQNRPAARAPATVAEKFPDPPEEPASVLEPVEITAFAVLKTKRGYVPAKINITSSGQVEQVELHQPVNSLALAYEYLQGDVAMHYGRLSR